MKKLTPNQMVEDVNKTMDFYGNILGFDFIMGVPEEKTEVLMENPHNKKLIYSLMKNGNIEMSFQKRESLSEDIPFFKDVKIGASSTFYFEVDNINEMHGKLKDRVNIVKELHTTWYGMQEFYIEDCNGYILGFGQPK